MQLWGNLHVPTLPLFQSFNPRPPPPPTPPFPQAFLLPSSLHSTLHVALVCWAGTLCGEAANSSQNMNWLREIKAASFRLTNCLNNKFKLLPFKNIFVCLELGEKNKGIVNELRALEVDAVVDAGWLSNGMVFRTRTIDVWGVNNLEASLQASAYLSNKNQQTRFERSSTEVNTLTIWKSLLNFCSAFILSP